MNKEEVSEVQSKLLAMNKVIAKLDPSIRSAAFDIMVPYYFEDRPARKTPADAGRVGTETTDIGSFIQGFEHEKPGDNVMLLMAWLYSQYGAYAVQAKEIEELANACGLVIPNRSDNTLRTKKEKGKGLFSQQGKGWKPTVSGELYFKNTYSVIKGNKSVPKD